MVPSQPATRLKELTDAPVFAKRCTYRGCNCDYRDASNHVHAPNNNTYNRSSPLLFAVAAGYSDCSESLDSPFLPANPRRDARLLLVTGASVTSTCGLSAWKAASTVSFTRAMSAGDLAPADAAATGGASRAVRSQG